MPALQAETLPTTPQCRPQQWFLNWGGCASWGKSGSIQRHFCSSQLVGVDPIVVLWVEAKGAAKHPTMHRIFSPHPLKYVAQNIIRGEVERLP